ncbi:MAG: recombinase family protein [Gammaproteobacteria bacterium]
MARKRVSATQRIRRYSPGVASDYLTHIDNLPADKTLAVILVRVSKGEQAPHLDRYVEFLTEFVTGRGHRILAVIREDGVGGQVSEDTMHWRRELIRAIETAREHPNAYVIAASTCRFVRHAEMNKHNQGARPTVEDFECLAGWANGVPLMTGWHPDLDWTEVKALQAKLFGAGRPQAKGPGDTKRRTTLNRSKVRWLKSVGLSFQEIADLLGTYKTQVVRWWKQLF